MQYTKCLRCGHKWQKRVKNPVTCPRCKSPLWNKKRGANTKPRGYQVYKRKKR